MSSEWKELPTDRRNRAAARMPATHGSRLTARTLVVPKLDVGIGKRAWPLMACSSATAGSSRRPDKRGCAKMRGLRPSRRGRLKTVCTNRAAGTRRCRSTLGGSWRGGESNRVVDRGPLRGLVEGPQRGRARPSGKPAHSCARRRRHSRRQGALRRRIGPTASRRQRPGDRLCTCHRSSSLTPENTETAVIAGTLSGVGPDTKRALLAATVAR